MTAISLNSATASNLCVDVTWIDPHSCVVALEGEIDLATAPSLKRALSEVLAQAPDGDVVLELAGVRHLDSTGLAVLIGLRRRLGSQRRLVFVAAPECVLRILRLTGLAGTFDLAATVDAAFEGFARTRTRPPATGLTPEAALAVGLAASALEFCTSYESEAACWLRILLPADSTVAAATEIPAPPAAGRAEPDGDGHGARERFQRVLEHARHSARRRAADQIRTGDVARGVAAVYGLAWERALRAHADQT